MSITFPRGFIANGIHSGVKKEGLDLGLLLSTCNASASGMFTTNQVKSPSVIITGERLKSGLLRGIIANSGCANACVGRQGFIDAEYILDRLGSILGEDPKLLGIASTGVIGKRLPMEKIIEKLPILADGLSREGGTLFERAIMTTDRVVKEVKTSFFYNGTDIRIGACAKGSGMIHPNMATLLSFVTTDLNIDHRLLKIALKSSIDASLNAVTIDKDMSTNDSVIIMANGRSGNIEIRDEREKGFLLFRDALKDVMVEIAKKIARDGEGASKLIEVEVTGTEDEAQAIRMARAVAGSNLFKSAVWGKEINWGRIISALGANSDPFDPDRISIYFGDVKVVENGIEVEFDKNMVLKILDGKEVLIRISVGDGSGRGKAWGCDLTPEYVYINGSYLS
ncbi:MAG TPA: bifunctional glutamate N-acetyltransferase/amino-acid acetyltransferase ArgJ [bacterium]|nr:bifunctional glutamate N-acetyltransferase/amino-acid acetyltransferase ArgJ [Dictyoglomota bacterium]HOK29141.1 bifunctional glutamate N-acetyltransferase/amino-acid acetyltransferase ArgJ [bacterium]HOL54374.1 bifunctional glutamate N-acetyltransferase/amino-acid acetyltransferase ArgJ [bacterium]HON71746.1 bifunctional glutamate N-acetyltransferase/amino-acid acetyltransferase ArgJ [bacterium]HPO81522.1 bifunctional glutamate N-acetyltransferase/amino-acid acetyltransferase ArgJ [bacteriu